MFKKVFTIYDKVAEEAGPLFTAINDGVAIRQTCMLLKDSICPEDYQLLCVATIDKLGQLTICDRNEIDFLFSLFALREKEGSK